MNSEEVKSALDRRRAHAAACERDEPDESPYYDDTGMMSRDAELLADAYLAAPQWRDKPTCAGLWLTRNAYHELTVVNLNQKACDERIWQRPCFGPIPTEPAT